MLIRIATVDEKILELFAPSTAGKPLAQSPIYDHALGNTSSFLLLDVNSRFPPMKL